MPPKPSRWLPALLATTIFMQMLDATVLNTALPQMAIDLQQSPLNMQFTVIAYALTLALLMPLNGYLCDRFGTKRVFSLSLWIFVGGSALCAMAQNLYFLVCARIIQGIGGAMLTAAPRLVMMKAYEKHRLLTMINYIVMPALIGPILGLMVGGYLAEYAGWHWIFLINIPFGLVAIAMTYLIMPDFRDHKTSAFDTKGFLLLGGGAAGLSWAVESLHHPISFFVPILTAAFSLTALVAYRHHAHTANNPLYHLDLFQVRTYRLGLTGNLISRLGISSMPFLMPLLLQVGLGKNPSQAGLIMAPIALAAIAVKPLVRPLMNQFGYRLVLSINTCLIGVLIASFSLTSPNTPIWILLPQLFMLGLCNSLQFSGMNSITLADLRDNQVAGGTSLMAVNQQLAISFGIALGAGLLKLFSSNNHDHVLHAFRYTFVTIGIITLLSSSIFAQLHRSDGNNLLHP